MPIRNGALVNPTSKELREWKRKKAATEAHDAEIEEGGSAKIVIGGSINPTGSGGSTNGKTTMTAIGTMTATPTKTVAGSVTITIPTTITPIVTLSEHRRGAYAHQHSSNSKRKGGGGYWSGVWWPDTTEEDHNYLGDLTWIKKPTTNNEDTIYHIMLKKSLKKILQ